MKSNLTLYSMSLYCSVFSIPFCRLTPLFYMITIKSIDMIW